jgi:hypothetical protein
MEHQRNERGTAFFQLQRRLKRAFIGQVTDSFAEQVDIEEEEEDVVEDTPKSDAGNCKPKARFGRRRTHNEQLIVCCCGVIAARATMFGAEAISGVKVSFKTQQADSFLLGNNRTLSSMFTSITPITYLKSSSSTTIAVCKNTFEKRKTHSSGELS